MVAAEYLKSVLLYEPDTGVFTWRVRSGVPSWWNSKYATRRAGSINGGGYLDGQLVHLGYFESLVAATSARLAAATRLQGQFARAA